jgi:hypothetical protein
LAVGGYAGVPLERFLALEAAQFARLSRAMVHWDMVLGNFVPAPGRVDERLASGVIDGLRAGWTVF